MESLEDRSHRPRHVRQPTYSVELVESVLRLREEYHRWGKDKLVILLRRDGFDCSTSTVGRLMHRLKQRGVLKEPVANHISARKKQRQRPYAVRKPREYVAKEPGDIIELDTLLKRMPFPIRAIQVDGGSEFEDAFEKDCQRRGIRLFVLPPRSPKLNPSQKDVERAHRTHTEEFYEVTDANFEISEINRALLQWEEAYNTIRPHQALGYLTPFHRNFSSPSWKDQKDVRKEEVSLII